MKQLLGALHGHKLPNFLLTSANSQATSLGEERCSGEPRDTPPGVDTYFGNAAAVSMTLGTIRVALSNSMFG